MLLGPPLVSYRSLIERGLSSDKAPGVTPEGLVVKTGRGTSNALANDRPLRRQLAYMSSIAYYRPWENVKLGRVLRDRDLRADVMIGLKDRVTMIRGDEWRTLATESGGRARVCVDPARGHDGPGDGLMLACLDAAIGRALDTR